MTEPDDPDTSAHTNGADDSSADRPDAVPARLDDGALEPSEGGDDVLLYRDLDAPQPVEAEPPTVARWLAFASIVAGGLLGGLIGYGTADLMAGTPVWAALGGIVGSTVGAVGVGVVAALTLRAMNEWNSVKHPESETRAASGLILRSEADRKPAPGKPSGDSDLLGEA